MKKIFLMALLVVATIAAKAQDTKPYEDKLAKLEAEYHKLEADYQVFGKKDPSTFTDAEKAKIEKIMMTADSLGKEQLSTILEVANKFKSTKFPAKYIQDIMYDVEYDQLKALCDPSTGYYNEPSMEKPKKLLASYDLRHPGLMFKELTMKDMDGKDVKLSQWAGKGKYVLVDFWASWCGPCRKEMPNVVEAYKQYKDKGLEIVGVSFDNNKQNWVDAVKKMNMTWPQMSDLKGWQSAASETYGIRSIPSNVLLDPSGKIIAMDLREAKLHEVLAGLLK